LGFGAGFSPVATGLFWRKMAKNGHFHEKGPKTGFLAIIPHFGVFWGFLGPPGPPGCGGFTSTPAGAAAGRPGACGGPRRSPGTPGGVSGPGPRIPGSWPEPQEGSPAPGGGFPRPRSPGSEDARLREGGFTSTPRAGALRLARGSPDLGSRRSPLRGSGRALFSTPPRAVPRIPEIPGTGPRREGLM